MKQKALFGLVSIVMIVAIAFVASTLSTLQDVKNENNQLTQEVKNMEIIVKQKSSLEEELTLLSDENKVLKNVLTEEQEKNQEIKAYYGTPDEDLLEKGKEITDVTPLDIDTAIIIARYSRDMEVNVSLILSLIELESNFSQFAVGADDDRGYMQIIPSTEKWLADTFGSEYGLSYDPDRIFEPEYNIGLGTIYLSLLSEAYGNDYNRILSEYNRGPYNLKKYFEEHQTYETSYSRIILNKQKKYLALND